MSAATDVVRYLKVAGGVAASIAAIVTTWTLLDLPTGFLPASRSYVDASHVKDDKIIDTVIELTLDQRDRLRRTRDGIQARLAAATDPQSKDDIQRLLEQANQDIADVANRVMTLERLRGK